MTNILNEDVLFIIATYLEENECYDLIQIYEFKFTLTSVFNNYDNDVNIDEYLYEIWYDLDVIKEKYFEIVKSLYNSGSLFTIESIVTASAGGLYDVVVFLHNISACYGIKSRADFDKENNENAMDMACKGGYLDIFKFLHSVGYEPTKKNSLHDACCFGHLEIVKYLYTNGYKLCNNTMKCIIENNQIEVMEYLLNNGCQLDNCEQMLLYQYNNKAYKNTLKIKL